MSNDDKSCHSGKKGSDKNNKSDDRNQTIAIAKNKNDSTEDKLEYRRESSEIEDDSSTRIGKQELESERHESDAPDKSSRPCRQRKGSRCCGIHGFDGLVSPDETEDEDNNFAQENASRKIYRRKRSNTKNTNGVNESRVESDDRVDEMAGCSGKGAGKGGDVGVGPGRDGNKGGGAKGGDGGGANYGRGGNGGSSGGGRG